MDTQDENFFLIIRTMYVNAGRANRSTKPATIIAKPTFHSKTKYVS